MLSYNLSFVSVILSLKSLFHAVQAIGEVKMKKMEKTSPFTGEYAVPTYHLDKMPGTS